MANRSERSRTAILEATSALLAETTVQRLSIEAIASRAGVGKTTIYRWWPSKAALVIDTFVERRRMDTPIRDDLPVRQAVTEHLSLLVEQYSGPQGRLWFARSSPSVSTRSPASASSVSGSGVGAGRRRQR